MSQQTVRPGGPESGQHQIRGIELDTEIIIEPTQAALNQFGEMVGRLVGKTSITGRELAAVLQDYPAVLAKEDMQSDEGLLSCFGYAVGRLPDEIFDSKRKVTIRLVENPLVFLDRPDRKTPKARARWYLVDEPEAADGEMLQLTLHIPDRTALLENLVHLSIVELVRQRLNSLADKSLFCQAVTRIISGSHSHQGNLNVEEQLTLWQSQQLAVTEVNMQRMSKAKEFKQFFYPDELLPKDNATLKLLAEKTGATLKDRKLGVPHGLFLANEFTYKSLLATALLSTKLAGSEISVRSFLRSAAYKALEEAKQKKLKDSHYPPLAMLDRQLQTYERYYLSEYDKDMDLKYLQQDLAIVQYLHSADARNIDDQGIQDFISSLKNDQFWEGQGVHQLISKNDSPIASTMFLVDFSTIKQDVMEKLGPLLKPTFEYLYSQGVRLLMTPYAPGELSYHLIHELTNKFHTLQVILEIGKAGRLMSLSEQTPRIGSKIIPRSTGSTVSRRQGQGHDFDIIMHNRSTLILSAGETIWVQPNVHNLPHLV